MKIYAPDRAFAVSDYLDAEALKGCREGRSFEYECSIHEYFVVQLVLLSDYNVKDLSVTVGALCPEGSENGIERAVTSLNTEPVFPNGEKKRVGLNLHAGVLQPVFFGVDFKKATLGNYSAVVNIGEERVELKFKLNDELVFASGAFDGQRLSRLGWLNSTKYRDKRPLKCFEEIAVSKNVVKLTGKELRFGNNGFIEGADFFFNASNALTEEVQTSLFQAPMDFILEGQKFKYNKVRIRPRAASALVEADGRSRDARIDVEALIGYVGTVDYTIKITAENNFISTYADLEFVLGKADYAAGLGMKGGKFKNFEYDWNSLTASDSLFVGAVNAGMILKLYERDAALPPFGMYKKSKKAVPVESWCNYQRGSVTLSEGGDGEKLVTASAGQIIMKAGEQKVFRFRLLFTPFKPLELKYTLGMRPAETELFTSKTDAISKARENAMQYIALPRHCAGNPYRNYPFDEYKELQKLTLGAHKQKIGLAIEYDSSSLSAHAPESGAIASMGDELIYRRSGELTPASWIAGGVVIEDVEIAGRKERDASYLLVPGSRMDNFFVEGVEFLAREAKVDGVLLSDTSMQRDTAERAAKCLERNRGERAMTELGFRERFDKANGYLTSLVAYADILPFMKRLYAMDKLDFGAPDKNLFELSGIPFGLAGDSSRDSSVLGSLLYAMLPRYGKNYEAGFAMNDIQKILKEFDISSAQLRGFWDPENPVRVDNSKILCTSFINGENMITVLYNISDKDIVFEVGVENKMGYTTVGKKVVKPSIEGLQRSGRVNFGKPMKLKAGRGMLITVTK